MKKCTNVKCWLFSCSACANGKRTQLNSFLCAGAASKRVAHKSKFVWTPRVTFVIIWNCSTKRVSIMFAMSDVSFSPRFVCRCSSVLPALDHTYGSGPRKWIASIRGHLISKRSGSNVTRIFLWQSASKPSNPKSKRCKRFWTPTLSVQTYCPNYRIIACSARLIISEAREVFTE